MMKAIECVLDLFFPTKCPFCGKLTEGYQVLICPDCEKRLPYTSGSETEQSFDNIKACFAPLYYEAAVRESIHRYKFGGKSAYYRAYAKIIRKTIDEKAINCDIITWVPLSKRRKRKRGYDQARLIADALAKELGIISRPLLVKQVDNKAQSGSGGRSARKANVAGVYAMRSKFIVDDLKILLIDDVVTTGATLSECASVLKAAGAAEIYAATLARHKD